MHKRMTVIVAMILVSLLFISCSKKTNPNEKSTPTDFGKINATSIKAIFWPAEDYGITKSNDIHTVMTCVKEINFSDEIKPFNGMDLELNGGPQHLEITSSSGTVKILLYNEKVIIEDTEKKDKYYCKITTDEYRKLYNTVVQYRPNKTISD